MVLVVVVDTTEEVQDITVVVPAVDPVLPTTSLPQLRIPKVSAKGTVL
jgi:hypothetical protein